MNVFRTQCNQWSMGVGLRRSMIYDSWRWMLWVNHGFKTWSLSWRKNPSRRQAREAGEEIGGGVWDERPV